jgi:hypothetical protein
VSINGYTSSTSELVTGVPQGSVLGPVLFNALTLPLVGVRRSSAVYSNEMFADDNQLLGIFPCGDLTQGKCAVGSVEQCIQSIGSWLVENNLCLNGSKTEFMSVSSARRQD